VRLKFPEQNGGEVLEMLKYARRRDVHHVRIAWKVASRLYFLMGHLNIFLDVLQERRKVFRRTFKKMKNVSIEGWTHPKFKISAIYEINLL
jgi:hypothetical protein